MYARFEKAKYWVPSFSFQYNTYIVTPILQLKLLCSSVVLVVGLRGIWTKLVDGGLTIYFIVIYTFHKRQKLAKLSETFYNASM